MPLQQIVFTMEEDKRDYKVDSKTYDESEEELLAFLLDKLNYNRNLEDVPPGLDYLASDPEALTSEDLSAMKALAGFLEFHYPYQEVRATVGPRDDSSVLVETFRCSFIAIIWTIIRSGFNEIFFHRLVHSVKD
ncbi:hypothetical protein LQ764DRAFT_209346 [Zygosaccharomyces rouxii]|nr:hypothetical protein LQ764DRAFT_209346 [Zygosaccharomyces rouxii]